MPHESANATRLLLDPWSTDYSPSLDPETSAADTGEIDAAVETSRWTALPPGDPPCLAWFIDGIRRLEARVIGIRNGEIIHGLFATFATGAVQISDRQAGFAHCSVERSFVLGSGLAYPEAVNAGHPNLTFHPLSTPGRTPQDLVLALQNAMRHAEATLASGCPDGLVFLDGPLAFLTEPNRPVTGVVKTIHRLYLNPEQMALVFALRPAERTPVFSIREGGKSRYSWYLRIAEPRTTHHGLSGIIRLETSAASGIDSAVHLARTSAAFLPSLASSPARDPRAPQNLVPVGALEDHLRTRIGDSTLVQRAIHLRIAEGLLI